MNDGIQQRAAERNNSSFSRRHARRQGETLRLKTLAKQFAHRLVVVSLLIAAIASIYGCGNGGPQTGHVEGIVRVNGQPTGGLLVRFLPEPTPGHETSLSGVGVTDDHGNYILRFVVKGKEGDGAPLGINRVLIEVFKRGSGTHTSLVIPTTYSSPAMTPLSKEVKPGDNKIDLDVKL